MVPFHNILQHVVHEVVMHEWVIHEDRRWLKDDTVGQLIRCLIARLFYSIMALTNAGFFFLWSVVNSCAVVLYLCYLPWSLWSITSHFFRSLFTCTFFHLCVIFTVRTQYIHLCIWSHTTSIWYMTSSASGHQFVMLLQVCIWNCQSGVVGNCRHGWQD